MAERVLYCWEGGPDTKDGCPQTCLLPRDHDGPHEWSSYDKIKFSFAPNDPEASDG